MTPGFPPPPALGVSLAGLSFATVPALLQWAADAGFAALRFDAAAPGMRPRDLDRSARRDLAANLRRRQLRFAGLDLWIPPEHFADPAHADRAADAVAQAVDLASDLARLEPGDAVVCVSFPPRSGDADPAEQVLTSLAHHADAAGVDLADFAVPSRPAHDHLRLGLDPAALLLRGLDPAAEASRAGPRLASALLTEFDGVTRRVPDIAAGFSPVPHSLAIARPALPSQRRLDLPSYLVALATASYTRPLVLDLRGVAAQRPAAVAVARAGDVARRPL